MYHLPNNLFKHIIGSVIEERGSRRDLLFLYDCETTGLSVYSDHIIEIAAELINSPVASCTNTTFSSLVKTSRRIPTPGTG